MFQSIWSEIIKNLTAGENLDAGDLFLNAGEMLKIISSKIRDLWETTRVINAFNDEVWTYIHPI